MGKNSSWAAQRLHKWTNVFIQDEKDLPTHKYGRFTSSVLDDEDLRQDICLHLQPKGKFVCTMDIVHFLDTTEKAKPQKINIWVYSTMVDA